MSLVRYILFSAVLLALAAGSVQAQPSGEYTDDFSTDKARDDSSYGSIFWPSDINNPPACSYLTHRGTGDARALVFLDYLGELAHLGYNFQVGTGGATLQVKVSYPCNAEISQFPPGQLFCSTLLPDGMTWSDPQFLSAGSHDIPLQSSNGTCYVLLSGARAVIDNLRVAPATPGATVRIVPNQGVRLLDKGAIRSILYVDQQSGSDENDGRSRTSAFASIQAAIDVAKSGDVVIVWPGVYVEEVRFRGRAITVQSAGDAAVIKAPDGYAVSFYEAEGNESTLSNFVITGCGVAGIFCDGASPTLRNLTISGNPVGVAVYGGANPYITNCIIWGNTRGPLSAWKANFNWQIYFSCVDLSTLKKSAGNINADPRFADPLHGDYHLKSPWGRYVAQTGTWTLDGVISPCLDAGDPTDGPRAERLPNGGEINMGAYGGTPFASHSSGPVCP
jgi:hypothetical protein